MTNLDNLATAIADECICSYCKDHVVKSLSLDVLAEIQHELSAEKRKVDFFKAIDDLLEPHEVRFMVMLRKHWKGQERIIVANLRKLKKAWLTKDKVDQVLYPEKEAVAKLSDETLALAAIILAEFGEEALDRFSLEVGFDVASPEVQKILKKHVFHFAKKLEEGSHEQLRKIISEMMDEGEGIPQITRRLREEFEGWSKIRAEMVARREVLWTYGESDLITARMAGMRKKIWAVNPDACPWCEALNGTVIGIERNFYDLGDAVEMEIEGHTRRMSISYESVSHQPLHPRCRCYVRYTK